MKVLFKIKNNKQKFFCKFTKKILILYLSEDSAYESIVADCVSEYENIEADDSEDCKVSKQKISWLKKAWLLVVFYISAYIEIIFSFESKLFCNLKSRLF